MLGLEPLLRARLEEIPAFAGCVHGAGELARAGAARDTPHIEVAYAGYTVASQATSGKAVKVAVRWRVDVVVRETRQQVDGAPARALAGDVVGQVLSHLLGWRPDGGVFGPLELMDSDATVTYRAGVLRFPLLFQSEQVFKQQYQGG